ncbi:M14 family metallopeptidase [Maribacter sp. 2304DJ31-5]|uniref:M14 family metallopeptidase n=1 Tax=Maribacter sp. 2304DJ31-5 TaxID=3386273 RepID=UPI0039BD62BA
MRPLLLLILILLISCEKKTAEAEIDFPTPFETSKGKHTANYTETIEFYMQLAKEFPEINIQTIGETDSGKPLHIVTYNIEGNFNFKKIGTDKTIVLINNGIHPGESDGIDATMLMYRDLASGKITAPKKTVLVTIPIYNIGGALNRNSTSRANQNGPKSYGFRGNARNFDLNRDFIKNDTKNAKTFSQIYHLTNPDIFIDNHVSNGADYQYTLTHLFTQHDKLGGDLGRYLYETLMPALQDSLANNNWDITPYVNVFNQPPEVGFDQFMDHPRYSTGYTTLWNTFGLMVETHMLKPYKKRVEGTYELMKKVMAIAELEGATIKTLRKKAFKRHEDWKYYPTSWKIDTTRASILNFKGFRADTVTSKVTGLPRLKYDKDKPFTEEVTYYDHYIPSDSVKIPKAYIIKKPWSKVIELLELNNIRYKIIKKDTLIPVESYKIKDFDTSKNAYEGHYVHSNTTVDRNQKEMIFNPEDILVPTDQAGFRYIMETLEPQAMDSFFNWNFFDSILQQKEGFSPYVFEDTALRLLENDSLLKHEFLKKKKDELQFSKNWYAQLDWLYKKSAHYETAHLQYPIYRIAK